MTVAELIEELRKMPQDKIVVAWGDYTMVESVGTCMVPGHEVESETPWHYAEVVAIT